MCNHPIESLIGRADGVLCRACGAQFKDFAELEASRHPVENAEKKEPAKKKPAAKKEAKADE